MGSYPLVDDCVAKVRAALSEETVMDRSLERIGAAVRALVQTPGALAQLPPVDTSRPAGPLGRSIELHTDPDHLFCVTFGPFQPGDRYPPHDHGELGWAVYGVIDGAITQNVYRRLDDGAEAGHARVEKVDGVVNRSGEVLVVPVGGIHDTSNESGELAWVFVIRSRRLTDVWRNRFDPAKGVVVRVGKAPSSAAS